MKIIGKFNFKIYLIIFRFFHKHLRKPTPLRNSFKSLIGV